MELFRFRVALVFLLVGMGLLAIAARLGYLQVALRKEMAGRAAALVTCVETIPAPRGRILARDGSLLALDRPVFDLHAYVAAPFPAKPGGFEGFLTCLEQALLPDRWLTHEEREALRVRLEGAHSRAAERARAQADATDPGKPAAVRAEARRALSRLRPRGLVLVRGIASVEALASLRERAFLGKWLQANLTLQPGHVRAYPLGSGGGPLVGGIFATAAGDHHFGLEELVRPGMPLQAGEPVTLALGKAGIFGRYLLGPPTRPETPGAVRTTLDPVLQVRLTRILGQEARRVKPDWAAALVMDPRTGAILALSSWPQFDPNRPADLRVSPVAGRRNHAIESRFEPGSTLKPLIVAAALEEGLIGPEQPIDCGWNGPDGYYLRPPGGGRARRIQDDRRMQPPVVPLPRVLIESSNIGAVKVGLMLGAERYVRWLRRFGLDQPSGLGLRGEVAPFFKQAEAMLSNEASFQRWDGPSISMGYAIGINLVSLASAYCPLVNGGVRVQPRLVHAMDLPGRGPVAFPSAEGERILSPETAELVRSFLVQVAADERGTAYRMAGEQARGFIGGKTGTARITGTNNYWAFFVGFAPAAEPRYVAVSVFYKENTYRFYGSSNAGPSVRDALLAALLLEEARG